MLNNFDNIYLQRCDFLKLRFTYLISDVKKPYKFDFAIRLLDMTDKSCVSIRDFLLSVLTNVIAPFLFLQVSKVNWQSVSIIYESDLKNENNLYLIPLQKVQGQISPLEEKSAELKISLRFQNNPRPTVIKIYGISKTIEEDENMVEKNLIACEKAFISTFEIENAPVRYRYIHSQTQSVLAKQKKGRNNLKLKQKLNSTNTHRVPFLATTYI